MEQSEMEQSLLNRTAYEMLAEQRRARRWSIFFKLLTALYVTIFIFIYISQMNQRSSSMVGMSGEDGHTALIEISGPISTDSKANADSIVTGLREAFENDNTKGVIIRINSPGGSPVQSGYITDEINRLRDLHPDIPIYAVISDICASGGYYIASAADRIYANKASIVGSIGVIMSGFGFVEAIDKLGVERRLFHAGENKGLLDPFSPLKTAEKEHITKLLKDVHQQFIDVVKKGRGERLKDEANIFSGLIWTGEQSVQMGLVDELGSASYVAREVIKAEQIIDFTPQKNWLDEFAKNIGVSVAAQLTPILGLR